MKKLLHERLRDYEEDRHESPYFMFSDGYEVWMAWQTAQHIADEIERYYIPRNKFIGEIDSLICDLDNSYRKADKSIPCSRSGLKIIHDRLKTIRNEAHPSPKVLDADGVEIKVGDTVWCIDTGTKLKVISQDCEDGTLLCSNDFIYDPDVLTHKEPDSLEKIYHDMMNHEYWKSDPNKWLKMADRLSALIEMVD